VRRLFASTLHRRTRDHGERADTLIERTGSSAKALAVGGAVPGAVDGVRRQCRRGRNGAPTWGPRPIGRRDQTAVRPGFDTTLRAIAAGAEEWFKTPIPRQRALLSHAERRAQGRGRRRQRRAVLRARRRSALRSAAASVREADAFPYDVTGDGQRFLVNSAVDRPSDVPVTLVVNWPRTLDPQRGE
jgi:hypothetical protein